MNTYIVLYRDASLLPADPPLAFRCKADDADHAEEQALNAEPESDVVWIVETNDVNEAFDAYWNTYYTHTYKDTANMTNNERRKANGAAALRRYNPKTDGSRTAMIDLFTDVIHYVSEDLTTEEIRSAFEMALINWESEEQNSEDIF